MDKYSKSFLNNTIKVWQTYSPILLSLNDAREIADNMTALFNFLISNEKKFKNICTNKDSLLKKYTQKGGGKDKHNKPTQSGAMQVF